MPVDLTTPASEHFLTDWGLTIGISGSICALIGIVVGWIIWKNTRRFTENIENGNREAYADYERTSDEMSKIKAELSGTED
ncbi:MAG: hypothetical protein P1U68_03395 [Verrucomicrobiales bacterium]|nr:hypothetical protein [Verrucomicrobiales bacterium]